MEGSGGCKEPGSSFGLPFTRQEECMNWIIIVWASAIKIHPSLAYQVFSFGSFCICVFLSPLFYPQTGQTLSIKSLATNNTTFFFIPPVLPSFLLLLFFQHLHSATHGTSTTYKPQSAPLDQACSVNACRETKTLSVGLGCGYVQVLYAAALLLRQC